MKKPLLVAALLANALPSMAEMDREIWKLPRHHYFQALKLRPGGKIAVYWGKYRHEATTHRCLIDEKSGRLITTGSLGYIPNSGIGETDIAFETFNARGQHAYLPYAGNHLRLKMGKGYKTLKNLPPFTYDASYPPYGALQDLKFSHDGEVLKVLTQDRLWIIGAQTGKLLRVIRPKQGKWWSRENATLSPDGFTILGMRDKMTLFSAKSGHVLKTYGIFLHSFSLGEFSQEVRVSFSPDGKTSYESDGEKAYEYPANGGKLIWKGTLLDSISLTDATNLLSSPDSRFYIDYVDDSLTDLYTIIKNARTHQIVARFPDIRFENTYNNPVIFSSDSQSIYWVDHGTLKQRPLNLK